MALAGCASPLLDVSDRELRRSVREATQREMAEASLWPEPVKLKRATRASRLAELQIAPEVLAELERSAGPSSYTGDLPPLGRSLYDTAQTTSTLNLRRAVESAVVRNLSVEFARLAPAISRQQITSAEAAFDATFFANTTYTRTDAPQAASSVGGFVSGVNQNRTNVSDTTAGIRKPLISGGQLTVQSQYTFTDNNTPGLTVRPNPANAANLVIQFDQPLLRGFGSDVNLAQVRLNRNDELDRIQQLKSELLRAVTDTESSYWNLVRAEADLRIIHRLLERGEDVLKTLKARQPFDTKPANISNAAAAVEGRRADFIRAQRAVRDASDRLKLLMNDPDLPIGGETLLIPADRAIDQPVEFSLVDALNAAFASRPEIQRAIVSIDNTSIRRGVADNARLPQLNLRALTRLNGLDSTTAKSFGRVGEAEFVDYQVGLIFEQLIGNRAAEAGMRGRRLEQQQAVISLRDTTRGVTNEVKAAIRDIDSNYELIAQTRAARVAAAEDLRALQVEEETIRSLSPEFLNLKLQRQQALAVAEQQEVQALTEYNIALARYYQATGTALERNQIVFDVPNIAPEPQYNDLFPDYPSDSRRAAEQAQAEAQRRDRDAGAAEGVEPMNDPAGPPSSAPAASPSSAAIPAVPAAPAQPPAEPPPAGWRVPGHRGSSGAATPEPKP
jgi:outer membrane protein